jgi:hypothetical protein
MLAEIIPSTVRAERYGWIYGHVLNVSVEGMMRVLTIVGVTAGPPTGTREGDSGSDLTRSG